MYITIIINNNIIILITIVNIVIIITNFKTYLTFACNKRVSTEGKLAFSMEGVCCIYTNQ